MALLDVVLDRLQAEQNFAVANLAPNKKEAAVSYLIYPAIPTQPITLRLLVYGLLPRKDYLQAESVGKSGKDCKTLLYAATIIFHTEFLLYFTK